MDRPTDSDKPFTRSARKRQENTLKYPTPVAESQTGSDCTLKSLPTRPQNTELPDGRSATQNQQGNIYLVGPATEDSLPIGWTTKENTSDVESYNIRYTEVNKNTGKTGKWLHQTTEDANNSFILQDLKPDTSYRIRIESQLQDGDLQLGDISDIFNTAEASQPSTPTSIRLAELPNHDSLKVTWDIAGNICRYTISLQPVGSKEWIVKEADCPDKPVTVKGLKPKTSYNFKIVAHTKNNSSAPGQTIKPFTTSAPLPPLTNKPRLVESGASRPTHETFTILWDVPEQSGASASPVYYTIQYRDVTSEVWHDQQSRDNQCTIYGLEPETSYVCRIVWHGCSSHSPAGPTGGPFKTTVCHRKEDIFKQTILQNSKLVSSDKDMPLHQLHLRKTVAKEGIEKKEFGSQNFARAPEEKVILIVGATGAGKSTLINGIVNYLLCIDWTDDFRFRLVEESGLFDSQHKSQTRLVTVYQLHHQDEFKVPYTLTIIDTPGFGDTDGIDRDKEITESINNLFKSTEFGVDHIDAIGFVVQSSLARLTASQKYIFDSILSLFGKDIESNIFLLITFCDPQKPPVLASIKEANVPYQSSFKFNNSALFASNNTQGQGEENEFNQIYWDMGMKAFLHFLNVLVNIQEKSLHLTKEVLEERKRLEMYVTGLHEDIRIGLNKLEQLEKEVRIVRSHEANIQKNKEFTYEVKVQKMECRKLEPGTHVTNCLQCSRTCHYPCRIKDNENKDRCIAMDTEGNCKVCQKHCFWNLHKNDPHKIIWREVMETRTIEELKIRYHMAKGKKMNAQKLIDKIVEDFHESQVKVLCLADEVRRGIIRLNEIALRRNPLSVADYIDILVKNEILDSKPGWKSRVEQLEEVKAQALIIQEVAKDGGYDPFADYQPLLEEAKSKKVGRIKKIADNIKKNIGKSFAKTKKFLNP